MLGSKYGENEKKDISNPENVVNDTQEKEKGPVIIEKETDEIEMLYGAMSRATTVLNLRAQPNTESELLYTFSGNYDEIISAVSKIRNGWYKVEYQDKIGYVSGDYLHILSEDEINEITVDEEYSNTYGRVNVALNVRSKANKSSTTLTEVSEGGIVKVFARMKNGWYLVEGNGENGYVLGEYLTVLTQEEYSSIANPEIGFLEGNVIARYTAKSTYNENSRKNMHLAADYINGTIINPGENYSHLKVIHPQGGNEPYVDSYVFEDGNVTTAKGGGVCMTSSTVYAAIKSATEKGVNTGLVVSAQRPHSKSVTYVPRKYEATVAQGSQDFCFRNCNNYAIRVDATYNYNTLTVTIVKVD